MAAPEAATPWWVTALTSLLSGFVGAAVALTAGYVRSVTLDKWNESRARTRTQQEILRNYLAPLSDACEKLVWRYKEIFIDGRHQWLKRETLPLGYNRYKRSSTLYRLACLMGWIRAINLELTALPRGKAGFSEPILQAIAGVQSALAEGSHVEMHRLQRLCAVWGIEAGTNADEKRRVAVQLEVDFHTLVARQSPAGGSLPDLTHSQKLSVCIELARVLCERLESPPLSEDAVRNALDAAVEALSYREALIYRDWQDAIGDAVLRRQVDSVRSYGIVGYADFETLLTADSDWMRTFAGSIDDVDFGKDTPNDFRRIQLAKTAVAVARVLKAIAAKERDLVESGALSICDKLLEAAFEVEFVTTT